VGGRGTRVSSRDHLRKGGAMAYFPSRARVMRNTPREEIANDEDSVAFLGRKFHSICMIGSFNSLSAAFVVLMPP